MECYSVAALSHDALSARRMVDEGVRAGCDGILRGRVLVMRGDAPGTGAAHRHVRLDEGCTRPRARASARVHTRTRNAHCQAVHTLPRSVPWQMHRRLASRWGKCSLASHPRAAASSGCPCLASAAVRRAIARCKPQPCHLLPYPAMVLTPALWFPPSPPRSSVREQHTRPSLPNLASGQTMSWRAPHIGSALLHSRCAPWAAPRVEPPLTFSCPPSAAVHLRSLSSLGRLPRLDRQVTQ